VYVANRNINSEELRATHYNPFSKDCNKPSMLYGN